MCRVTDETVHIDTTPVARKNTGGHILENSLKKENFFGIPKLSDIGRSLENVLGKFQECSPGSPAALRTVES